jgi:hypothetical protein
MSRNAAELVRSILSSKQRTLHQVSAMSAKRFGRKSPYFVPHHLYSELRNQEFSPSIYQLFTLSGISNYLLSDWFKVFGLNLDDISYLQAVLPSNRTVLLDSSVAGEANAWMPWFDGRTDGDELPAVAPLSQLIKLSHQRRLSAFPSSSRFLYAKVGKADAMAFPDLIPGSIIRANTDVNCSVFLAGDGTTSTRIFLIRHSKGVCCCLLRAIGREILVPVSSQLPFAQVELRLGKEVEILGVVDLEIRPLARLESPDVAKDLARRWTPRAFAARNRGTLAPLKSQALPLLRCWSLSLAYLRSQKL